MMTLPSTLTPTKKLATVLTLIVSSSLLLSGCQATKGLFGKRDNGSLEYQSSEKIAPLQLPADQETAPFVPLYPTPTAGVNTLDLKNESGKQYRLPKPERTINSTSASE